jgi:alkanesulfonate monooxygenase SsuD/methylene tetrahydromethanopterin reductase-like flavin-dependent oxidoreductase (luciferase family)
MSFPADGCASDSGWSPDEYEAAGASWSNRGKRADEFVRAIKAIWTTNPVEFKGEYVRIPRSLIGPKPVQKPHPPIYMAAYAPSSMKRVAREANGWFPVGVPIKALSGMFDGIKGMAKEAGRNPAELELLVRGNVEFSDSAASGERVDFTGTIDQIGRDIAATKELGASELFLDVQFSPGVETKDDFLKRMEQLWKAAKK